MPADPTPNPPPPPTGRPRRRPAPAPGGSWVWMVLLLLVVAALLFQSVGHGNSLDYSDFIALVGEKKPNLKRVQLVGVERIEGEVADVSKLPEYLRGKLKGGKFSVQRPKVDDQG